MINKRLDDIEDKIIEIKKLINDSKYFLQLEKNLNYLQEELKSKNSIIWHLKTYCNNWKIKDQVDYDIKGYMDFISYVLDGNNPDGYDWNRAEKQ